MKTFICTGNPHKSREFKSFFAGQAEFFCLNDLASHMQSSYQSPVEDSDFFITNGTIKLLSALQFITKNNLELLQNFERIVVDDSGLLVPALDFLPGVHSASFAGFPRSDQKNNQLLMEKINQEPAAFMQGPEKRLKAFYVCFLFSLEIPPSVNLEFIKNLDFSHARVLLKNGKMENKFLPLIEKKLLEKVDLTLINGRAFEKIKLSLLCDEFPDTMFIDLHYGYCCGEVSTHEKNMSKEPVFGYDSLFYPLSNLNVSFSDIPLQEKNKLSHRFAAMESLRAALAAQCSMDK